MAEDKLRRQEYYRKFYTDLNDMRIEMGFPPKKYHLDLPEDEVFTRTIFIKIHNEFYAVSCKELNQVFSRFGVLEDVVQFNRGHGFHSKICFNSKESTMRAFEFLNGRNIYDDCCTMELFLVVDCVDGQTKGDIVAESPNQDQVTLDSSPRSSSMEESTALQINPSLDSDFRGDASKVVSNLDEEPKKLQEKIIDSNREIEVMHHVETLYTPPYQEEDCHGNTEDPRRSTMNEPSELNLEASSEFQEDGWAQEIEVLETTTDEVCPVLYVSSMEVLGPPQIEEDQGTDEFKPSTVILDPIVVVREIEYGAIRELVKESMALIDIKWIDIKISSLVVDIPSAYKVFDVLPRRETVLSTVVVDGKKSIGTYMNLLAIVLPYDRDGLVIFDPGGVFTLFVTEIRQMTSFPSEVEVTREAEFLSLRRQWDPGGKARLLVVARECIADFVGLGVLNLVCLLNFVESAASGNESADFFFPLLHKYDVECKLFWSASCGLEFVASVGDMQGILLNLEEPWLSSSPEGCRIACTAEPWLYLLRVCCILECC